MNVLSARVNVKTCMHQGQLGNKRTRRKIYDAIMHNVPPRLSLSLSLSPSFSVCHLGIFTPSSYVSHASVAAMCAHVCEQFAPAKLS